VYPHLAHPDRFVRYAARVALEHQPVRLWQNRVLAERSSGALLNGMVALARQGDKSLQPVALAALDRMFFGLARPGKGLSPGGFLALCGVYSPLFPRRGEPDKAPADRLLGQLDPAFPSPDDTLNRELVQLLVYLKSPTVVEKCIKLLQEPSKPLTQAGLEEVLRGNGPYGGGHPPHPTQHPAPPQPPPPPSV